MPEGTFNGSIVSGCPGFESGREIRRELADGARTLGKVAGNGERPLTGFRLTGVNWSGGCSAGFQMSSPDRTRTCDKVVNSHLLYQLSYRGLGWRIDDSPNAEIYWTAPTLAREE